MSEITGLVGQARILASIVREAVLGGRAEASTTDVSALRRLRYVRIARTVVTSGASTLLTVITGFISIALTVRYLGTERYGVWLTISTILAWLSLSDLGVGNALTNKLSEAYGRDQASDAQRFTASAFWLLTFIGIGIMIAGAVLAVGLPWAAILNVTSEQAGQELPEAILLSFAVFGLGFPLSIVRSVYRGHQEGYYSNGWDIVASGLSLLSLVAVTRTQGGLPLLVLAVFGTRQIVQAASAVHIFRFHRPWLIPDPRKAHRSDVRPLLSLGIMFIITQLCALLITQTDNLVIIRILGPGGVAIFGTTWRLFSYVAVLQTWFLTPLWPAYGEAYARSDMQWISRTLRWSVFGLIALTLLIAGGLALVTQDVVRIWVGPALVPSGQLIAEMMALQVLWAWTQPFVYFLNGISRLRNQTVYGLATALLSVLLKVALVSRFGIEGAVAAALVSYALLSLWLLPLDSLMALRSKQSSVTSHAPEAGVARV